MCMSAAGLRYTLARCPGKVLVTGGYLVLERPDISDDNKSHAGLSLSLSVAVYALVVTNINSIEEKISDCISVQVNCPQTSSMHSFSVCRRSLLLRKSTDASEQNGIIVQAVRFALMTIKSLMPDEQLSYLGEIYITVCGDNDFYVISDEIIDINNCSSRRFREMKLHPYSGSICKTGLGSSAAVVAAICTGLIAHFICNDSQVLNRPMVTLSNTILRSFDRDIVVIERDEQQLPLDDSLLACIHNTSQMAHSAAQGNVGSGFDVSTAIYGSQLYSRFTPLLLREFITSQLSNGCCDCGGGESERDFLTCYSRILLAKELCWNQNVVCFTLPPGLSLMIGDVRRGSHTPSMVSQVLAWRRATLSSENAIFQALAEINKKIQTLFSGLSQYAKSDNENYAKSLSETVTGSGVSTANCLVLQALRQLRHVHLAYRALLRQMGDEAKVPIEPLEQTQLLDATLEINGTFMAGVPGAGGYDAVFVIYISDGRVKNEIETLWREWGGGRVVPLTAQVDGRGTIAWSGLAEILSSDAC